MAREPQRVDSRGIPVRSGMYNPTNRHGELQDVSGDQQVSFADTFLGDLLGFDSGGAGLQGNPGMLASIQGARRAAPMEGQPQPQPGAQGGGGPDAAASAAPSQSLRPQRPQMRPEDMPIDNPMDSDEIPRDENGNPLPVIANAAVAGAGAAAVARRLIQPGDRVTPSMKNEVALVPDEQGNVYIPRQTNRGTRYETVDARQATDGGWTVVGLEYNDGSNALQGPNGNALPAPAQQLPAPDGIENVSEGANVNSNGADQGTDTAAGPTTRRQRREQNRTGGAEAADTGDAGARPTAPVTASPEDAPISTEDVMGDGGAQRRATANPAPQLPPGATMLRTLPDDGGTYNNVPLAEGVTGFRNSTNGKVYVKVPGAQGGGYIEVTPDMLQSVMPAIRGALRGAM